MNESQLLTVLRMGAAAVRPAAVTVVFSFSYSEQHKDLRKAAQTHLDEGGVPCRTEGVLINYK